MGEPDYNARVRQLWRALHNVPQLLLVQPEQLSYDLAYALALLPLVIVGLVFFRPEAIMLFATSFLSGIVCLLALLLARLAFSLPAWIGYKATHPLVASILIAVFFSPLTPAWVASVAVILFIVVDTVLWPRLPRVIMHPALIVFGLLYLVQRQLHFGFINPFDRRPLADPLSLWYQYKIVVDPIKLYVGNIPGPLGLTSAAAVLLGLVYLWYTRKISLGVFGGFLIGLAVLAAALPGADAGFQLSSAPALFLAGYVAADRRRVPVSEPWAVAFGVAAGLGTMVGRWYGQGQDAAWQSLLAFSAIATIILQVRTLPIWRGLPRRQVPSFRMLRVESRERDRRPVVTAARPVVSSVRPVVSQPAMAVASSTSYRRSTPVRPVRTFDVRSEDDLVRQMRKAAIRGSAFAISLSSPLVLIAALVLVNPIGLMLTWSGSLMSQRTKWVVTALSPLWYLAVAGLALLLLTHR
jgi:Na+-translocating ferredoxin:NAD+ oxidoreductase subunit D